MAAVREPDIGDVVIEYRWDVAVWVKLVFGVSHQKTCFSAGAVADYDEFAAVGIISAGLWAAATGLVVASLVYIGERWGNVE